MPKKKCKRCGLCCCFYVKYGNYEIILPSYACKHFTGKKCDIYHQRPCLKHDEAKKAMPYNCPLKPKNITGRFIATGEIEKELFNALSTQQQEKLLAGFEYES